MGVSLPEKIDQTMSKPTKNNVKPTEKQLATMRHLASAKTLQEAMLAGGYDATTALNPRQNFIDAAGTKVLLQEYRGHLIKAGVSPEILAEIEVAGLFEENGAIRLGYLKEVKKSFGLGLEDKIPEKPPTENRNTIVFVSFNNATES
jgi:hypothetical protein